MSTGREPIRSYQRIFRPERRIYQLEGKTLPVPGGVPLRWLAYATLALLAVLAISSGSGALAAVLALTASLAGFFIGGRAGALAAGLGAFAAFWVAGLLLGLLDWPLRLAVVPVAVATLATQATPDGRRGIPPRGVPQLHTAALWVAPDEHGPRLRRARLRGPALAAFASEVRVRRGALRQGRLTARPDRDRRPRRGELATERLVVGQGELLEVRP